MATHPVREDTVNICVNMPKSERNILRQLALKDGRSLSKFIRQQVVLGLRTANPAVAVEMEEVRKQHHEKKFLSLRHRRSAPLAGRVEAT